MVDTLKKNSAGLSRKHARHLLRQMLRVRRLEEKSAELYTAEKIRGFLHLYIGEEAVAAGVMETLEPDDAVVATYREHGHALLRGVSAGSIMAEMYGKQEGCSRGRGGSMHLFDRQTSFVGGNAIVAGGIPLAVGLALAYKMQGLPRISCVFFGEGAAAEGEFYESMNLAALWHLPVLFVCENNLYAMGTALDRSQAETDITRKSAAHGIKSSAVDGMDVVAVEKAAKIAVRHVRSQKGPYLLEARTYRFRAHSMFDPELYRDKSEVERWKTRDPIRTFFDRMKRAGVLKDEDLAQAEKSAGDEVAEAVRFAEEGTWEPEERLLTFVYTSREEGKENRESGGEEREVRIEETGNAEPMRRGASSVAHTGGAS